MVNILLYAIINEGNIMEKWTQPKKKVRMTGFAQKVIKRVSQAKSITIRSLKVDGLWVYYFHQEGFLFILAADGQERSARMQNYLRILTEIFYQNYDQRHFPTVMERIITQINRMEERQVVVEEQQGLISGYSLLSQKQRFSNMLVQKQRQSRRAYVVSVILFLCILGLGIYYLYRKNQKT